MPARKKLIMVGRFSIIEPLGILYLLGIAKRAGWDARVVLVKNFDFEPLMKEVCAFKPDLVGFSIWTGYHLPAFEACDTILRMGIPVAIGGPHATFSTEQCASHATWVVKGEGFRNFRMLLEGQLNPGIHFDEERMAEGFPMPDRPLVYSAYPALGKNRIKSIIASIGCPFKCSYCYAPHYNNMYGGFELNLRPVAEVVAEALTIEENYPVDMIYFQDDIFGFNIPWLREFAKSWREKVRIPWHCQIRLELTRDIERLELFREAGCTGITLAIESGNDFLRQFVLLRPMADQLIVEGIKKIQRLGFSLRTEQILAVPFSDIDTDIETLELNCRLNPEIAWTSILAPYGGTNMGAIASRFQFFERDNDALSDTFFDRSVLHHAKRGIQTIRPVVLRSMISSRDNPLLNMTAKKVGNTAKICFQGQEVCKLGYLSPEENERYCDQTVVLQRLFSWLSKVPDGSRLARNIVDLPSQDLSWGKIGSMTEEHLLGLGYGEKLSALRRNLTEQLGCNALPEWIKENPYYFCFFPGSADFARKFCQSNFPSIADPKKQLDFAGNAARHWLYDHALYKTQEANPPLALATTRS